MIAALLPILLASMPWPGSPTTTVVDSDGAFESNLSGLAYRDGVLFAVQNNPSRLHRLERDGDAWTKGGLDGWTIRYPDGTGVPDTEDLTFADPDAGAIYLVAERDNAAPAVSRLSILRVDPSLSGSELIATHEWDLTASLPEAGPNLGLEAITWIPDALLVEGGFRVEETGRLYAPRDYPDHGGGLFFVGAEATGVIYAFALDHADSTFTRIPTIESGQAHVVSLALDGDRLWAYCDDTCGNRASVLELSGGRFAQTALYDRPSGMPDLNNEGIALAPDGECRDGRRPFFWADDSSTDRHALREGTIDCSVRRRRGEPSK